MGLPIFLIDFLCILSNSIDNFNPNPFIFDFSRNPDRSEIHLFSICQDFPISPVKAVKKLLKHICTWVLLLGNHQTPTRPVSNI